MVVWDVVYGRFELPEFLAPLIASPEFRRLSEVRLLNINSPSLSSLAEVRRYSHTLGVLYLAMQNPLLGLGRDEHRALLATIIVHDAGTPAFAHLFEYALSEKTGWNHEDVVTTILRNRHHVDTRTHQFYSTQRPRFKELCRKAKIDFDLVIRILEREHPASKLVFGTVDFDNIDNVARMNVMLGNQVDIGRLVALAASLGADANTPLLLPESQKDNLMAWSELRRKAYEVLVFDPKTVAGQAVLSTVIDDALTDGTLAEEDWGYTDAELIATLKGSSAEANERLEKDFFGMVPELMLLTHVTDQCHPLFRLDRGQVARAVCEFLTARRIARPYGYSLRDRGTFEKAVRATDPITGQEWGVGTRSDSIVIYGFGRGGTQRRSPRDLGGDFLAWTERSPW